MKNFLLTSTITILATAIAPSAFAQSFTEVEDGECSKAIPLKTFEGQLSTIDVSPTGEIITYIGMGDRSRHVVNTDLPLDSGQTQAVFILPIEKIDFPGATSSATPNLVIRTRNLEGQTKTCNFVISTHVGKMDTLGVKFVNPPKPIAIIEPEKTSSFNVSYGRTANADDVEAGLEIAIAKGYTNQEDEVNTDVRRFVFELRNGSTVDEALNITGTAPEVVETLAEFNLDLPPLKLERPYVSDSAPNTKKVTERIYLGQELFLKLQKEVRNGNIERSSQEYQNLKQTFADIKRGKDPFESAKENNLSSFWINWLQINV